VNPRTALDLEPGFALDLLSFPVAQLRRFVGNDWSILNGVEHAPKGREFILGASPNAAGRPQTEPANGATISTGGIGFDLDHITAAKT
jgi:hypothetical protein